MYNDRSSFYRVLLFLIWPMLALAVAFRNYKSSWGKNILWAFVGFYGFAFAIGAESQGSDILEYVEELQYLHNIDMSFFDVLIYFQQSNEIDVVRTFIAVTLSQVTGSQAILTLIYGIIFGFFFSRNMWFVFERLEGKLKPIVILLIACFFLVVPPWEVNGFRFWTATHVFIYGVLPYLFDGKKSGIFIAVTSILFHFSFLVPVTILLCYILAGNRLVIYFSFFLLSFFVSEVNIEVLNNIIENYTPEIFQERTSSYRSQSKVDQFRSDTNSGTVWYAVWYGTALKWSLMAFMSLIFFKSKQYFLDNQKWLNIFSFTLLFFGFANLLGSIPSGGRFLAIANMFSLALIILYIQNREEEVAIMRLGWVAMPALLLFVIVAFRTGLYSMSVVSVLGNPVIALFMTGEFMSLNDFLKSIL